MAPQVRDPTKEILSGLLRSRGGGLSSQRLPAPVNHPQQQLQFGRVEHTRPEIEPAASQFEMLQRELFGQAARNRGANEPEKEAFGSVHRFSPNNQQPSSQLDAVRSMLAQEEGQAVNEESKNAFDRIREKLLSTRARDRYEQRQRGFRKKGSKKRRRNVRNVVLLTHNCLVCIICGIGNITV